MDGTLLNSRHELPEGTADTVRGLKDMGIRFAAASGRQYYSVKKVFDTVGISDDIIFIAENGGIIFEHDKIIHCDVLPDSAVLELTDAVNSIENAKIMLSGVSSAYIYKKDAKDDFGYNAALYCGRLDCPDDISDCLRSDKIIKIAVFDPDAEHNCYPVLQKYGNDFNVVLSGANWVDIVTKSTDKGNGLRIVSEYMGISPDEIMAFGDYLNDLTMIEFAGESYAMENAHPLLKSAAKHIAPSNDDNGVIKVLGNLMRNSECGMRNFGELFE